MNDGNLEGKRWDEVSMGKEAMSDLPRETQSQGFGGGKWGPNNEGYNEKER